MPPDTYESVLAYINQGKYAGEQRLAAGAVPEWMVRRGDGQDNGLQSLPSEQNTTDAD